MSTETKGLRTAPLTMLVSLLVGACAHVMFFGRSGADHWNPLLMFAVGGFRCAEVALGVFAAMELVKRTNGRVALGARIALGGYAALCAWFVINQLINFDPTQLRKECSSRSLHRNRATSDD